MIGNLTAYHDFDNKVRSGIFTIAYWRKMNFPLASLLNDEMSIINIANLQTHLELQFCHGLLAAFKPVTMQSSPVEDLDNEYVLDSLVAKKKQRSGKRKDVQPQKPKVVVELGPLGWAKWAEDLLAKAQVVGDKWAEHHSDDGKGRQEVVLSHFDDLIHKAEQAAKLARVTEDTPIETKIECGYYDGKYDHFQTDVFAATNTSNHPKRLVLFDKAWDIGDGNHGDVLHEYCELVNLLK